MSRLPLPLRLALRQLGENRASAWLTALAVAIPTTALIVVQIVSSNDPPVYPDGTGHGWTWTIGMLTAAATLAIPVAFVITVMVGAAFLVSARRHERTLALLETVGAGPAVLFRVVSAVGLAIGTASALISIVAGLTIGYLWLGPAETRAADATINPAAVLGIALVSVLLGWAASVVPAIRASSLDLVRGLHGTPKPMSGRWSTGRAGRIVVAIGAGIFLLAAVAMLAIRAAAAGGLEPDYAFALIFTTLLAGLLQLAPLVVLSGLLLSLPGVFRTVGGLVRRLGIAPRLAARDAERNWGRSVPAAAAIMVTTFVIGSYLTNFGVNAVTSVQSHWWSLQSGQVSVGLVDPGYSAGAPLDPRPVTDPEAIVAALDETLDLAEARILDGMQGPFYGLPVDDDEGYSGRQELVFPPGGLPHPEIAGDGPCSTRDPIEPDRAVELAHWRCETSAVYAGLDFELSADTPTIWVGDAADLELMLGGTVDAATRASFARGEALVFDARYRAGDGTATISWWGEGFVPENEPGEFLPAGSPLRSASVPAHLVPLDHRLLYGILLDEATASDLGLTPQPSLVLASLAGIPTQAERLSAADAVLEVSRSAARTGEIWLPMTFELGPPEPDYTWSWGALLLALGVVLAVATTAIGLARVEGRGADTALAAVGAAPGIRRRISAWYALIVVGSASLGGTLVGVLPAYLTLLGYGSFPPVAPPLLELGLLAIGVPLVVALAALAAPVRPR